jgi:hypothetical protein
MNSGCRYNEGGEVPDPHTAPAMSNDDGHLFGVDGIGGAIAAGVKPPWAYSFD